ncbi:type II toxin-antitoxin system RelB/DinJ family antitoxin [Candidatus Accumulibacter phosphatis]
MAMRTDTDVRARIDTKTKKRAVVALKAMGLSISDAIRLLMVHVADERCLPFEVNLKSVKTGKRQPVVSASTTQRAARE